MPLHPSVRVCTHIKVTGVRCGSPALRGERFCYFHQRALRGVPTPPNARLHPIAMIENEEAIQASIMEVINALARNMIDLRRADLILKALYIAVKNSRRVRFNMDERNMVREVPDFDPASQTAPAAPALQPAATTPVTAAAIREEYPEAEVDPTQRKPPARAGLPAERKKATVNARSQKKE